MKKIGNLQSWIGGISNSKKFGPPNSFAYARSIDFRTESSQITVQPRTTKISGSIVEDLPMWADIACDNLYFHGNTGRIYRIDEDDAVNYEYTVPNSQGNGLVYFPEDKYLYIPTNTSITRRSNACGTGNYVDYFLESSGGEPTNTKSLSLVAASSQSATRADTASLSVTGDLTLEAFIKPSSLPTGSNQMTIISKWDESGALRSYKLGIVPTSAAFGNGSDSALVISVDTTESPIDSACLGTVDTNVLSATNASFAAGQKVLIHQSRGTEAGKYQINEIQSYTAGTITLVDNLNTTFVAGAQVRVMKQYTNVTINSGVTYTAKAWDGTVGGILGFFANGTVTITGHITATAKGFQGAPSAGATSSSSGLQGEGTNGAFGAQTTASNGNGGGGGQSGHANYGAVAGGGGGGNGTAGGNGETLHGTGGGIGGSISSSADLTTMTFGGGGGTGGSEDGFNNGGGRGGGIICIFGATTALITGTISAAGEDVSGVSGLTDNGQPGGGAGGCIYFRSQTIDLGTNKVTAPGGAGATTTGTSESNGGGAGGYGGNGGSGVIHIDYSTSYAGTTTPALNVIQDTTLNVANGSALRLYISSTGSNSELYTQNIDNPEDFWSRFSVAWDASASTAYFYKNATLIGTKTGALTAIHDNATEFGIGVSKNSGGTRANFYDGLIDDVRVWNTLRTPGEILNYNSRVLNGTETGLVAYYEFSNDVTDSQTSGLNDLTANNTPTYSTDVPFSGVSTRGDEDVFIDETGDLYTLTTGIDEGATHRQTFVPTKEPMKSLAFNIDTVGTGNWTVVIHDSLNHEVASVTVPNADIRTGIFEFVFASSFRLVLNAPYHVHIYSSVADGKVVTSTISDLETAYLKTYFQILVDDQYHPARQFLNFLVIGNERYVATFEAGNIYQPHRLILPSGYRVRALAYWRDFIAIGTWKGTSISDTDQGKIFFWDGTSDTYVEPLDVPQGAINALFGQQGRLFIAAGYKGKMLEYTGGDEANILFTLPEIEKKDTAEIAPGAITMWSNMLQVGSTFHTNSITIHPGVYTFGREGNEPSRSLGFDYPLSIGDLQSPDVHIGSVFPRAKKLYIGWQNSNAYGIDMIDVEADPYPTSTIETLIADLGGVSALKLPLVFRVDFLPLTSGQSVSIKYKANRESSWHTLKTEDTTNAIDVKGIITQRVREIQFATDIVSTTTSPIIIGMSLESEGEEGSIRN